EFTKLLSVEGGIRLDAGLFEPLRFRYRVGIKGRVFNISAARPEANAAHLVGIGLSRHSIGAGSLRSSPAGKTAHRKVEASPEEMHGTGLADEVGPESVEDGIHRQQNTPKFLYRFSVVRSVHPILVEGNRIGDFDWHAPDFDFDPSRPKHAHEFLIEISYRARHQEQRLQ